MQYGFGLGILSIIPPGSNPTPLACGVLQDVTLDLVPGATKKLHGQYKFPVAIAEGEGAVTGKAGFARLFSNLVKEIMSGSRTTGQTIGILNEPGTIPSLGPYTVSVAQAATFVDDLSVIDATTGLQMQRVSSGPATGQYSVSAGVYTFAAADAGHVVWITYDYTTTGGYTTTVSNSLMGSGSTYTMFLFNQYASNYQGFKLPAVVLPKLSFGFKNADFTTQNVDFEAFADTSGKVLYHYSSE